MLFLGIPYASAGTLLQSGDKAPDFTLKDSEGKSYTLTQYRDNYIVLYFYPKNDTPGCTQEACNFRDNFSELKEKGIIILGVSYDDASSHKAFREKYNLPFPLLSDTDKSVSETYGAKGLFMPKRITYLISPEGLILHVFDNVDTQNHSQQILDVFNQLPK
ncbi:peroxiredoxin [bacterium]|nr:peroxiredoxin [candidate division CSSED10-310 bacterium]